MSKLTVEKDKYGLVRVKVETTKSGTPVTYMAPANTGLSGQNDQAIAAIVDKINETDDVIPSGTSPENKLMNEAQVRELMLNTIGGRTYKTTKIGNQIWLAENLDFKFYGLKIGTDEISSGEPCAAYYNNDEATYGAKGKNYGLLYNKEAHDALNAYKDQLIPGWRVATMDDWQTLFNTVGSTSTAADQLKATTEWGAGAPCTDPYKFTAYPSGTYDTDENSFSGITYYGYWWAVGMYAGGNKTGVIMSPGPNIIYDGAQDRFYNIRLVRDA